MRSGVKSSHWNLHKVQAFTLVELLVVISIIALLLSVLLPALKKAREQALTVKCLSSLKQVGLAFNLYSGDNKGLLPGDYIPQYRQGNNDGTNSMWQQRLMLYASKQPGAYVCPNYLRSYKKEVLQNPAYPNAQPLSASQNYIDWFTPASVAAYGYNHRTMGCEGWTGGDWGCVASNGKVKVKTNIAQLKTPSQKILCLDNRGSLAVGNIDLTWASWYFHDTRGMYLGAYRHKGGVNILFTDCHVEWSSLKSKAFSYYPVGQNPYWDN